MKAKIFVVDLLDHTIEEFVGEGNTPAECFISTLTEEEQADENPLEFYAKRTKKNDDGKWVIDCEDGLIFVNEITE